MHYIPGNIPIELQQDFYVNMQSDFNIIIMTDYRVNNFWPSQLASNFDDNSDTLSLLDNDIISYKLFIENESKNEHYVYINYILRYVNGVYKSELINKETLLTEVFIERNRFIFNDITKECVRDNKLNLILNEKN